MFNSQNNQKQDMLVKDQGRAYDQAVNYLKDLNRALTVETEEYIITLICQPAEGMYAVNTDGQIIWQEPSQKDNQHIKVIVQDRHDLRFVPELQVYCKLTDVFGNFIEERHQRFVWHPIVFYYGENWAIPENGDYIVSLTIKSANFRRYGQHQGKRYNKDITLDFSPVKITLGKKNHQD